MKPLKPNYDDGMWKGAPKESFDKARDLRRNATAAEELLWKKLRNKQLDNYKFRRQHPVSLYIDDFYCHQLKLVAELTAEELMSWPNGVYRESLQAVSEAKATMIERKCR